MSYAATTSPFLFSDAMDTSWILWSSSEPLNHLQTQNQTDGRFLSGENHTAIHTVMEQTSPINYQASAKRYHSVLARMDQACKKAAGFSSWSK